MREDSMSEIIRAGVIVEKSGYIDRLAHIEAGAIIGDDVTIRGSSIIRSGARVLDGTIIEDAEIGRDTVVTNSVISNAYIGDRCTVGPWAHVHKGSKIGDDMRIGNFVEIKNSAIGDGTKVAHLAYVGDADVGSRCNIGCGAVFVNYDGITKRRSKIGNGVFVGSNVNVVAPVTIEDGAYIAAGSTLTISLPRDALCIARCRETIKENASKYKPFKEEKHRE